MKNKLFVVIDLNNPTRVYEYVARTGTEALCTHVEYLVLKGIVKGEDKAKIFVSDCFVRMEIGSSNYFTRREGLFNE